MRSLVSGRPTRYLEGYGTTFGFSLGEDGSKKTGSYGCPRNTISVDHRCRRFLIESFLGSGYPPADDALGGGAFHPDLFFTAVSPMLCSLLRQLALVERGLRGPLHIHASQAREAP